MSFLFSNRLLAFEAGQAKLAVDQLIAGLEADLSPHDNPDGEISANLEAILKEKKKSLKDQVGNLGLLPQQAKDNLKSTIDGVRNQKELRDLLEPIKEAIDYLQISKQSNLFTDKQIGEAMDYLTSKAQLKKAKEWKKMLLKELIPEEKRSVARGMYWWKYDPDITMAYHEKVKEHPQLDKRNILAKEVESNLSSKYQVFLEKTFDLTTDKGRKKKDKLEAEFKAMFDSKEIKDFEKRQKSLIKAQDFLTKVEKEKGPAYKLWHKKQNAVWSGLDNARLLEIYENLEVKHQWDVKEHEQVFALAKKEYEKELKSRFQQLADHVFIEKETVAAYMDGFEKSDLQTQAKIYDELLKKAKDFSITEKKWLAKIDFYKKHNPAIVDEFNERYAKFSLKMDRKDILSQVEDEHQDLLETYQSLLERYTTSDGQRLARMKELKACQSFTEIKGLIKALQTEILLMAVGKEAATVKSQLSSDEDVVPLSVMDRAHGQVLAANDNVELPENIDQVIMEELAEFFVTDRGQAAFLLWSVGRQTQLWQEHYNQRDSVSAIIQATEQESQAKALTDLQEDMNDEQLNSYDKKKKFVESFVDDEDEVYTFDIDEIQDDQVLYEKQDRVKLAEMLHAGVFDSTEESKGNVRVQIVNKDRQNLDLTNSQVYDYALGSQFKAENKDLAVSVLNKIGQSKPTENWVEAVAKKVDFLRVNFCDQNHREILKRISNDNIAYAA